MNEQQLKQRMTTLVVDGPAATGSSADDLRRGRRRVALRRASATAGSGFVAVAAVAMVITVVGSERPTGQPATGLEDEQVLQRCSEVDGGLDPALFGMGSRVVTAEVAPDGDLGAVVLSPDGAYWARCWVFDGPESGITPAVTTYPVDARPAAGREIGDWEVNGGFRYVDRFPADVARIDAHLSDGRTLTADAVDGFVVFQRQIDGLGDVELESLSLYAANGALLADESMAPGDGMLPRAYTTLLPVEGIDPVAARCVQVSGGVLPADVFGVGSQVLTSDTGADGDVSAVVLSSDRRYWAECHLSGSADSQFTGSARTYSMEPAEPRATDSEVNSHAFGEPGGDLSYVDRFRPEVARVELRFPGGPTLTADAVDGFVAFERDQPGIDMRAFVHFTLYDADGNVLADTESAPGDATLPRRWWTLVPSGVEG